MVSLKQLILFAAIFNSIWGFANQQKVLQEIVQEKETDGVFGNHNTFGDESDPASPHVQIFWKDEKSTPPGWNTHKSPDNETLLDVSYDNTPATYSKLTHS